MLGVVFNSTFGMNMTFLEILKFVLVTDECSVPMFSIKRKKGVVNGSLACIMWRMKGKSINVYIEWTTIETYTFSWPCLVINLSIDLVHFLGSS